MSNSSFSEMTPTADFISLGITEIYEAVSAENPDNGVDNPLVKGFIVIESADRFFKPVYAKYPEVLNLLVGTTILEDVFVCGLDLVTPKSSPDQRHPIFNIWFENAPIDRIKTAQFVLFNIGLLLAYENSISYPLEERGLMD